MTEQSKIPVPEEGKSETAKGSLIERATDVFGIAGLKGAPVPRNLAPPPAKRVRKDAESKNFRPAAPPKQTTTSTKAASEEQLAPIEQVKAATEAQPVPDADLPRIDFRSARQTIDRDRLVEQGLILPESGASRLLEEFRILKRQVMQSSTSGGRGKGQRVLVCSPLPGEGKTFTACNLALAMAVEKDIEVVLVDADFAKPSVLSTLGLSGGKGLMDALADPTIAVEDCVLRTDLPGLSVLPAGTQTDSDSEFLASERTREVLARLTQGAPNRLVIFDSPPALAASPAAELAGHVGQALLIARADNTSRSSLEDAVSLLAECRDIKLILNATSFSPSGRRFGTYYGYGG